MKLIFARHGEPNYETDRLTEKGWREAEILSNRISKLDVKEFFVSPLGRAQETASVTLKKMNRTAETLDWLREFDVGVLRPDKEERSAIAWDWMPDDWTVIDEYFTYDKWWTTPVMTEANVKQEYDLVTNSLDELLAKFGYERNGRLYNAVKPNTDTYVFFCHFGVTCVMLSHLIGVSPMVLWHGAFGATTSICMLKTEERRKGLAFFRMHNFGDVSHLYEAGEPSSTAGSFCEVYEEQ